MCICSKKCTLFCFPYVFYVNWHKINIRLEQKKNYDFKNHQIYATCYVDIKREEYLSSYARHVMMEFILCTHIRRSNRQASQKKIFEFIFYVESEQDHMQNIAHARCLV